MPDLVYAPAGLYGVVVSQTKIAKSTADGSLIYRGYSIQDLVENSNFEEVAYLICKERLPTRREFDDFKSKLTASMIVPKDVLDILRCLPRDSSSMDALRAGLSILATKENVVNPDSATFSIAAKMPTMIASGHRLRRGQRAVVPNSRYGYAENFLRMLLARRISELDATAFEKVLILYMEHDFNASAFTVRVVASTKADIYSAVIAGLSALKGPLHGGANQDVISLMNEIRSPDQAEKVVKNKLEAGEKVPGFGHRIYKTVDPRAQIAKRLLKSLSAEHPAAATLYETCTTVESVMWREKRIPANLDFYAAPIFSTIGISVKLYTSIFAMSRVFGWIAHFEEQSNEAKLIRPEAEYVGLKDLKYIQLDIR